MTGHRAIGLAVIVFACTSALLSSAEHVGAAIPASTTSRGAISLVQHGAAGGGNGPDQAINIPATGAGDLIVVGTHWCQDASCVTTSSIGVSNVTDSTGDACAQVPGAAGNSTGTVFYEDIWYCQNVRGGNETITVTYSGSVYYHEVYANEFSGVAVSSPVDGNTAANLSLNPGGSPRYSMTNLYVASTGSTSQSGDLVYSLIRASGSPTISAGSIALNNGKGGADEYQVASSAGPYLNRWTLSSSQGAVIMGIAAFKASTGTPGPPTNSVSTGAYNSPSNGDFEGPMEAWETWLGQQKYSNYSVAYSPYAFDCVGGGTACMMNLNNFYNGSNYWFPISRQRMVWSIALTGCDHAVNLSGLVQCTTGHTIPLVGAGSIASGYEDSIFNAVFSTIKSAWPNAIVRLGWEMNLNGSNWTWGVGGSAGGDSGGAAYVAAFQHVAALAHRYGFKIDWCPNIGPNSGAAESFYPGDAYVDLIGMDFYDYAGQDFPFYQALAYGLNWHAAFAHLHAKPMAYDEWGCGGTVSSDAHCANIIGHMGSWLKANPVLYFNFWNVDASDGLSRQICDNGTVGACGTPYQNPLSAAAFLANF